MIPLHNYCTNNFSHLILWPGNMMNASSTLLLHRGFTTIIFAHLLMANNLQWFRSSSRCTVHVYQSFEGKMFYDFACLLTWKLFHDGDTCCLMIHQPSILIMFYQIMVSSNTIISTKSEGLSGTNSTPMFNEGQQTFPTVIRDWERRYLESKACDDISPPMRYLFISLCPP